jgi:hypothetical protein
VFWWWWHAQRCWNTSLHTPAWSQSTWNNMNQSGWHILMRTDSDTNMVVQNDSCGTWVQPIYTPNQNKHHNTITHTLLMTPNMVGDWSKVIVMVEHCFWLSYMIVCGGTLSSLHVSTLLSL